MPFNQVVNTLGEDAGGKITDSLDMLSLRWLVDIQLNDSYQSGD